METDNLLAKRRTIYLPGELDGHAEKQAKTVRRSVSNYIAMLIERDREQQKTR